MDRPRGYDQDRMESQARSWYDAAEAFRTGRLDDALDALLPVVPDREVPGQAVTICTVGVLLTAINLRRRWAAQPGDVLIAEPTTPGVEADASERLACDLVAYAGGDLGTRSQQVADRVVAWVLPPKGDDLVMAERTADLIKHLLPMFAAVTDPTEHAGGEPHAG